MPDWLDHIYTMLVATYYREFLEGLTWSLSVIIPLLVLQTDRLKRRHSAWYIGLGLMNTGLVVLYTWVTWERFPLEYQSPMFRAWVLVTCGFLTYWYTAHVVDEAENDLVLYSCMVIVALNGVCGLYLGTELYQLYF